MSASSPAIAPQARTAAAARPLSARLSASRRALVSLSVRGLWAALLWLHAHLLWQRIANLTLFEPLVALRWGAAMLSLAALLRFRHVGVPLFRGRRALILWLVILLLHAGSAAAVGSRLETVADSGLLIVATLWLLTLEKVFGGRAPAAGLVLRSAAVALPAPGPLPCAAGTFAPLSPRPPPPA